MGKNEITIDIPEPIMSLWFAEGMFCSECFDSEREVLEFYKEKQIKQEAVKKDLPDGDDFISKMNRGSMLIGAALPSIVRYDYLGDFLGATDVFRKVPFGDDGDENTKFVTCGIDTDHYSYLVVDPVRGAFWNSGIGNLYDVYKSFRGRGIELSDDIYKKEEGFLTELAAQLKKEYPKLSSKREQ